MARLLWLPDVLRSAGLTVHEVSGWKTRGSSSFGPVQGITIHETRGSRTSTDAGEINTLINGSATAPPPIAPLYLSRTGHWHVVASGTCNHNRVGWAGPNKGLGNDSLVGIEAQHALGEPWTDRQYESYVTGTAALARKLVVPVGRIAGHKEHQPGGYGHSSVKTDPSFSMTAFRADVARALAGDVEDDMFSDDHARKLNAVYQQVFYGSESGGAVVDPDNGRDPSSSLINKLDKTREDIAGLAVGGVDVTALAELLKPALISAFGPELVKLVRAEVRDAVADQGEGGSKQVRAG